jgi:tRNASer (uridine44-2'-O)-methyltransferase
MADSTLDHQPTIKRPQFKPKEIYKERLQAGKQLHSPSILGSQWLEILEHECDFDSEGFFKVLHYLIRNPNINSTNLFRADILYDSDGVENVDVSLSSQNLEQVKSSCPYSSEFAGFQLKRTIIRRFVPRNDSLDRAINQSVFYYQNPGIQTSLLLLVPHETNPDRLPFYHPRVAGIAYLHTSSKLDPKRNLISLQYRLFPSEADNPLANRQIRTAFTLLGTLYKHGQGELAGYKKRVHHDQIIDQKRVQDRFSELKRKYAQHFMANWVENTDPSKQVFEQIGIAAFLIELWRDMYASPTETGIHNEQPLFPGFVDIGCGNGVLVEILLSEGYDGQGVEGHRRKTWDKLKPETQRSIAHRIVVPAPLDYMAEPDLFNYQLIEDVNPPLDVSRENHLWTLPKSLKSFFTRYSNGDKSSTSTMPPFHNGLFPSKENSQEGPFIISNHADELTAWTPMLGSLMNSSFMIIPCCSRNLSGEKFRAPSHANNYTTDEIAPGYFNAQKPKTLPGQKMKHIPIPIPIQAYAISTESEKNSLELSPTADADIVSLPDSPTSSDPLALQADPSHKYHFVNAAPLVFPHSHPPPSAPSNQAAETGDLKTLSRKNRAQHLSAYQALCAWLVHLADQCGYLVEREILRIPSTRNFGIVGRFIKGDANSSDESEQIQDKASPVPIPIGATYRSEASWEARMKRIVAIVEAEGGASRERWLKVCEREIVKGGDARVCEHG